LSTRLIPSSGTCRLAMGDLHLDHERSLIDELRLWGLSGVRVDPLPAHCRALGGSGFVYHTSTYQYGTVVKMRAAKVEHELIVRRRTWR
jgi:hypothetical protein